MKFVVYILGIYLLTFNFASAQSVDLLWQGETYTPPFYEGRALWSKQSRITLVAIPHGLGNSTNLNYKWTKSGTVLGKVSGVGKDTLTFDDTVLSRAQLVKVDIISSNGGVLASASTSVSPETPAVYVYENNPLYGYMFHREIGNTYTLTGEEVTLTAFPLFFTTSNRLDDLVEYEWRTNTGDLETNNSVTYRIPDGTSGTSQVTVKAIHGDNILQNVGKNFLVKFGENNVQ